MDSPAVSADDVLARLAAVIAEISVATLSDFSKKRMPLVWPCLVLAAAAFYGS